MAALFFFRLFNLTFVMGGEGVALVSAWRISGGEVPHRDFFEIIPPFSFLPTALFFKVFGAGFPAERLLNVIYALLLMAGCDVLLCRYTRDIRARLLLLAVLVPFGYYYYPLPSHHWVVDILHLFSLWALSLALAGENTSAWAGLSGFLSGLACFSLQDQGGFMLAALTLFFFPFVAKGSRSKIFLPWAAGGLIAAVPFAVWLLPRVAISDLLYQLIVFPLTCYKNRPDHQNTLHVCLKELASGWSPAGFTSSPLSTLSRNLLEDTFFLLPVIVPVLAYFSFRRKWVEKAETSLLLAGSAAFFCTFARRPGFINMIWAAPVPLVFFCWAFSRGLSSPKRRLRIAVSVAAVLLALSAAIYSFTYFANASREKSYVIETPAGRLRSLNAVDASLIQQAIDAIEREVPPGAPIFCKGYAGLINFMTLRRCPTRYNFFLNNYHTGKQAKEAASALDKLDESYVFMALPFEPQFFLDSHIGKRYRLLWQNPIFALFYRGPWNKLGADGEGASRERLERAE